MQRLKYNIQFHTYWHCGSGLAAGADVDALVVKDKNGLPFVPGKTIKGLVRQAFEEISYFESPDNVKDDALNVIKKYFGFFDDKDDCQKGELFFSNATMKNIDGELKKYLFSSVAQTAIDDNGIADKHSLRQTQVVIPCELEGYISNVDDDIAPKLRQSLKFIKRLGTNRTRGLGRCTFVPSDKLEDVKLSEEQTSFNPAQPLKFKCKLLSDVILNEKSASEGNNKTLDYIPGSCFMGIVANQLFDPQESCKDDDDAWEIIQSSNVKFSDAHPVVINDRSIRIPASFQLKKGVKITEATENDIYNSVNQPRPENTQYKQCRVGFYSFEEGSEKAIEYKTSKNFAIKSAYNREKLRSEDAQMYGYESLQKGQVFLFSIECPERLRAKVYEKLVGVKRIGRSRTSQYGQAEITLDYDFTECKSNFDKSEDNLTYIYADSRLIFVDEETLNHTLQPTIEMLGLQKGKILWEKSQIQTFQYSPWNYVRQCFDTDRVGFEKGSVIVVEGAEFADKSGFVGSYQNEGFGRIIVNPEFLAKDKHYNFDSWQSSDNDEAVSSNKLIPYLEKQRDQEYHLNEIYKEVNNFVFENTSNFNGFKSQWGTIRSWAMRYPDCDELEKALFDKEDGYLMHGKSAEKWSEHKRKENFEEFFYSFKNNEALRKYTSQAVINLAAQMAKNIK